MFIFAVFVKFLLQWKVQEKARKFRSGCQISQHHKFLATAKKFGTVVKFQNRPVAGCTEEPTEKDKTRNSKVQVKKKKKIGL